MDHITEFLNEEGFELKGYISQLFEKAADNEQEER